MKILSNEATAYTHTAEEARDILISILVLGFAFAIALFGGSDPFGFVLQPSFITFFLFTSLLVAASVIAKEMAQKGTARTLQSHATYRLWSPGVILSVLSSFLQIVFTAVGGIKIATEYAERAGKWRITLTPQQMGIIGLIGPLMSLSLAMAFIMLSPLAPSWQGLNIFLAAAEINTLIALFSLLPFNPLDGEKILRWNATLWTFLIIMSLAVLALTKGWI